MISETDLRVINPKTLEGIPTSSHIQSGVTIPKSTRIKFFSPEEWEEFTEEWASSIEEGYSKVRRFGGSGDLGVDVAGFCSDIGFEGDWDNYQCKRYNKPLQPSDIWVEIGKIIYYSYKGYYVPPRKFYFVCSQGIGTSLEKLLNNPCELRKKTIENWDKYCLKGITSTLSIPLSGDLKSHMDSLNFSIFSSKSSVELIKDHAKTCFHTVRFGGGLPVRNDSAEPPFIPTDNESRYIRQLLDAYGEHLGVKLKDTDSLKIHSLLSRDYLRQRGRFYHAESLKTFARDNVPAGTFESLQEEIYHGVIDTCENEFNNGFTRMKAAMTQASAVAGTSNPLVTCIKTQDRQGICHQLANDDRLKWVMNDG